ncbi:hypothetical protein LINPERPRIM_LOCUS29120 [Linum perenne]
MCTSRGCRTPSTWEATSFHWLIFITSPMFTAWSGRPPRRSSILIQKSALGLLMLLLGLLGPRLSLL